VRLKYEFGEKVDNTPFFIKEEVNGSIVPQIVITITYDNLNTFLEKEDVFQFKEMHKHFLEEALKREGLKRKREGDSEQNKKQKIIPKNDKRSLWM